jgi:hypothetical protein
VKTLTSVSLMASVAICQSVVANTIHVCATCAHTTIQSAVNDAIAGDTIAIAASRFTENVTIEGKQLTLQGSTGGTGGVTEVYAAGRGPVFTLGSGVPGATPELIEIHNLVIGGGNHFGGSGVGGGVQVRAGAYLHLYDSTLLKNKATSGGGVGVSTEGAPKASSAGALSKAILEGLRRCSVRVVVYTWGLEGRRC